MNETHRLARDTLEHACEVLLSERDGEGLWRGRLSSSALATAVAAFALTRHDAVSHAQSVQAGVRWLRADQNEDGGWGDSPECPSNLTATLLGFAAMQAALQGGEEWRPASDRAQRWLERHAGGTSPDQLSRTVLDRYGVDRTFAAPILMMCAAAGLLGDPPDGWRGVPQLPFELAALPRSLYRWLRLDVVSYAVPALVAVGLARHAQSPSTTRPLELARRWATGPALRRLERMQPPTGGYLEAPPLSSFVAIGLCAAGLQNHPVVRHAARFLRDVQREDGSWPIEVDLSGWCSSLAVRVLSDTAEATGKMSRVDEQIPRWTAHLRRLQRRRRDVFTGAAPGGWPWTNRPGGVPDADDTSASLVALWSLSRHGRSDVDSARRGVQWLMDLQNADGGIPTFCRGWGRLPFDRSCVDITAHALEAMDRWYDEFELPFRRRIDTAMQAATAYLAASQCDDGSWVPLWFGNPWNTDGENPVFGTARVVGALRFITPERLPEHVALVERAADWLAYVQNADGGWGGDAGLPSTVEETALALRAMSGSGYGETGKAVRWLCEATDKGSRFPASPIGLYFESLWYSERLYPIIFTIDALNTFLTREGRPGH